MKTYEISFSVDNRRHSETVRATSYFDARRLIEQRYPGCFIWNIRET